MWSIFGDYEEPTGSQTCAICLIGLLPSMVGIVVGAYLIMQHIKRRRINTPVVLLMAFGVVACFAIFKSFLSSVS